MKKILLVIISIIAFIPIVNAEEKPTIHVFYSETCIHCKHLHEYLDKLSKDSVYGSRFNIEYYEASDSNNQELFRKVATYFNISSGVPVYIIGESVEQGFPDINSTDERMKNLLKEADEKIKSRIDASYKTPVRDIVEEIKTGRLEVTTTTRRKVTTTTTESNEDLTANVSKDNNKNYLVYGIISVVLILIAIILFNKKKEVKE